MRHRCCEELVVGFEELAVAASCSEDLEALVAEIYQREPSHGMMLRRRRRRLLLNRDGLARWCLWDVLATTCLVDVSWISI